MTHGFIATIRRVRRNLSAMLAGLAAAAFSMSAQAATACGAELHGAQKLESDRYALVYRMLPAKLAVGKHFALEFVVCPKGGNAAPSGVVVDAFMPEHGHGMNYKATVKRTGGARYRADGLMFHMPGRWDLAFELQGAGQPERLTRGIVLE